MKRSRILAAAVGLVACFAALLVWGTTGTGFTSEAQATSAKTGVGLAEHALKAYHEGWKYRYGCYGQIIGGKHCTDCSGLIKSYLWWTGDKTNPNPGLASVAGGAGGMLASATAKGTINLSNASSLPRIHGLCLYSPGHAGIYLGNGYSVDNRCTGKDVRYQKVIGGTYHWTTWFKLPQIQYPQKGFVSFEGSQYYYENGQYVVNTTQTINGADYSFNPSGKLVNCSDNEKAAAVKAAAAVYQVRTLRNGMSGDDVLSLQKKLHSIGYLSAENCTGYFGPITQKAVTSYQAKAGLIKTGTADTNTMKLLSL